jgi:hypothetical protein
MTLLIGYRHAPLSHTLKHQSSRRATLSRLLHRAQVNPRIKPVHEVVLIWVRGGARLTLRLDTRWRSFWVHSHFCKSQAVSKQYTVKLATERSAPLRWLLGEPLMLPMDTR